MSPDLASNFTFAIDVKIGPTSASTSQVPSSLTAFIGRTKLRYFLINVTALSVASAADFTSGILSLRKALFLEPGHHLAQVLAHLFNFLVLFHALYRVKYGTARLVLQNPLTGKGAVLNLSENLAHLFSGLLGDDSRAAGEIAVLGRVTDGITHIGQAAFIYQVDNQLHFVQAFEIGDFRLIPSLHKRIEAGLNQFTDAAAEHGLLTEKVGLGLFCESSFDDSGAGGADTPGL